MIHGKRLEIYRQGGADSVVAWHTGKAVYWISNTLEDSLSNGQMVAMAESFTKA